MTKQGFHRGVRLHGDVLRETRLAQGLRQAQLAKQAGVAERTVRKAESGQVIEKHIADYICTVLHLSLEDTMQAMATKRRTPSARLKARRFERDLRQALLNDDATHFLDWLHPEVQWRCISNADPSIYETASGKPGALELIRRIREWIESAGGSLKTVELIQIHSTGDLLYIQTEIGMACLQPGKGFQGVRQNLLRYWSAKLLQFDDGLIRNLEHFFGPIPNRTPPLPSSNSPRNDLRAANPSNHSSSETAVQFED